MGSFIFLPSLVPEIFNFEEAIIHKISNTPHVYAYNIFPALWMQIETTFVFIFRWSRDVIDGIRLADTENPGVKKKKSSNRKWILIDIRKGIRQIQRRDLYLLIYQGASKKSKKIGIKTWKQFFKSISLHNGGDSDVALFRRERQKYWEPVKKTRKLRRRIIHFPHAIL